MKPSEHHIPRRRQFLKSLGATFAGVALSSGTTSASHNDHCYEKVDEMTVQGFTHYKTGESGPPFDTPGAYVSEPIHIPEGTYPEDGWRVYNKLVAAVEWENPYTDLGVRVDHRQDDWTEIAYGSYEPYYQTDTSLDVTAVHHHTHQPYTPYNVHAQQPGWRIKRDQIVRNDETYRIGCEIKQPGPSDISIDLELYYDCSERSAFD